MSAKKIILELYQQYHDPKFLIWDPLSVARRFQGSPDLEWIALISALFAFGGVKQIIASVERVLHALAVSKENTLISRLEEKNEKRFIEHLQLKLQGFRHRIYTEKDLILLLLLYRRSRLSEGSLEAHFLKHHVVDAKNVEAGLSGLIADYREWVQESDFKGGTHFKHMLNSPAQKSACKRWLMYLKWMVRADDGIDLGVWQTKKVKAHQLLIPLDTHLFKISKKLKLTQRKTVNWLTAIEVTESLKKIAPNDPTRFDFSLCRYGMFQYRKKMSKK